MQVKYYYAEKKSEAKTARFDCQKTEADKLQR